MNIAFRSATSLCQSLRDREFGCLELLDHYLGRVDQHNPRLNAVVTMDAEGARLRAREADEALAKGKVWGPLHGLPMTVKDSIEVAGMRTTSGATELYDHIPTVDASAIRNLKAAGAIIFGKTNLPPYAGDCQTYNEVFGTTNNPWNLDHIPGGSSGGAAAAISAGLTGLELGSDLGGSARFPAHCCGVYGHKTSNGIVPFRGHVPYPSGTLAAPDLWALGPFARDADDLSLALDALVGPSDFDTPAWTVTLPPPRQESLKEFRVAAWLEGPQPVDREILGLLEEVAVALENHGVAVSRTVRPNLDIARMTEVYNTLVTGEFLAGSSPGMLQAIDELAGSTDASIQGFEAGLIEATRQRYLDWTRLNEERTQWRVRWAEFFNDVDVLLTPASGVTAFPHAPGIDLATLQVEINGEPHSFYDQIFWTGVLGNCCYLPATVAPIGLTSGGLPVGVHIVGPYLGDLTTIRFTKLLSEVIGGYVSPPGFE